MTTLPCPQVLHPCIGSDCKSHGFSRAKSDPEVWEAGGQLMEFSTKVIKDRKGSF